MTTTKPGGQRRTKRTHSDLKKYELMTGADGRPTFPFFSQVSDKIKVYLRTGIDDVGAAYRMACQATPHIAAQLRADALSKDNLRRRQEAEKARQASMSTVSSIPTIKLDEPIRKGPVRNPGGAPRQHDWDAATIEVIRIADIDNLPKTQASMWKRLRDWFEEKSDRAPAESELKKFVSNIYGKLRAEGWEPNGS